MHQLDVDFGIGFWVGIDKKYCELNDECLSKSLQVQNDFGSMGYGGPCPPEMITPIDIFYNIWVKF